jgi:hypothetical protein
MVANIDVPGSPLWLRLAGCAKLLSSLTLVWLTIEGVVGVVAGVLAGSIALSRTKPEGHVYPRVGCRREWTPSQRSFKSNASVPPSGISPEHHPGAICPSGEPRA